MTVFALFALVTIQGSSAFAATRGISVKARTRNGGMKTIPLYSDYYALVIGCGDYTNGWPHLPNAVKDAREIASALRRMGWKVDLLENPDGDRLSLSLNQIVARQGRKQDRALLVWYSGHGYTLEEADGTRLGYIVPVDAPLPRDELGFITRAVDMRQMETVAKRVRSRHMLMVFDSCFSGAIFASTWAAPSDYIQEKVARPVREFITAGSEDEEVPDRSVFKTVFIQGIADGYADRNSDGYVTGEELGAYLQEKVVNYSHRAQHPQYGKINNPKLDKGDFIFLAGGSAVYQESSIIPHSATGTLKIETSPSGATVYVQGRKKGRAPVTVRDISPGPVDIEARLSEYSPESKRVTVRAGRTTRVKLFLDRVDTKGRLYVNVEPSDARVRILNIGSMYHDGIELETGRYHIEVSKSGYQTYDEWVDLGEGEDLEMQVRLEPVAGRHTAASGRPSGDTWTDPVTGMEFIFVKGGCYEMGCGSWTSSCNDDEKPVHTVCVDDFYIGKYEVTQGQWKKIMHSNPSEFDRGDNYPVENVSWYDAQKFIEKLNSRSSRRFCLPTEAEWEYAARSGGRKEKYAGSSDIDLFAWYGDNSGGHTHPVGTKAPNGLGIYDMSGNVWEWCRDRYSSSYYSNSPRNNPQGPLSSSFRVFRGGSWYIRPRYVRSAHRGRNGPAFRDCHLGFRLAFPQVRQAGEAL